VRKVDCIAVSGYKRELLLSRRPGTGDHRTARRAADLPIHGNDHFRRLDTSNLHIRFSVTDPHRKK